MGRIIALTLLADIGGCLAMLIFFTISEGLGMGLYAGIMTFGNILIPTFIAVLIYRLINKWITFKISFVTILVWTICLSVLFILGLFIWAAADALFFETLTLHNIIDDYNSEFSGFLPVVFVQAHLIPILDLWLVKQDNKNVDI